MRLLSDAEVRRLADPVDAAEALADAFAEAADGGTALLPRQRITAGGTKLSTMAAVLPGMGVAGAKVYTTIEGRFRFVVLLFDADSGKPLAAMEADALTEFRTAAVTEVVCARFAAQPLEKAAVFGTGVQARAHIRALARRFAPAEIALVSRSDADPLCQDLTAETGVTVRPAVGEQAVRGAQVVVTATRATDPLFDGDWLEDGAFVAAVGSTLPHARELDDTTMRRAGRVLVEDRRQALAESGDLIAALSSGALDEGRIVELAPALAARDNAGGVTVFKSVGIALEDVAVAARIWRKSEAAGS